MSIIDPNDARPIHFIGIAGAGMRALAELFARQGVKVSGCDSNPGTLEDLESLGIEVSRDHDPSHLEGVRHVIVTSAMPKDHPELVRAKELGIPITRRAEALGEGVSGGKLVAVAGTHGKTTTTVMTTGALDAAGLKPTGIAGGRVADWKGNLRYESNELYVVEADEYDRSFLALSPDIAVVTNVEADHLDIYHDLEEIRSTFARFIASAAAIVLCADDAGASTLDLPPTAEVIRYGLKSKDARLVATAITSDRHATSFDVSYDGKPEGRVQLHVPGTHNVLNALAAIGVGLALGLKLDDMKPGLARFAGVERRFQHLGDVGGITIIDDYAHHPTEIAATLQAARASYPGRRIIAAFQPHLFTRTRDFCDAFGESLCGADSIFLTEIYPAREKPIAGITSDLVANAAERFGKPVSWRGERSDLAAALEREVKTGDVVITIGAGDITRTGKELQTRLATRAK